jgi:D-amino peptidase
MREKTAKGEGKMKILVAADMEGVGGVVHWDHVTPGHGEYVRFRRLMTGEVNAALRGAFEAGADEVVVCDGHAHGRNILVEELDPRARLNSGSSSPWAMVQGVDSVDAAMFVGYHARAGAQNAILDHTWSNSRVANVWLNGRLMGETGLNAAVCGHFGVPVVMLSGDQTVCAEAQELLGQIEVAVVKQASGQMAAECLSPEVAQRQVYQAAVRAVNRLQAGEAPEPLCLSTPVTLIIEFVHSDMADQAVVLPGAQRLVDRRIEFAAGDVPTAYRAFQALVALA